MIATADDGIAPAECGEGYDLGVVSVRVGAREPEGQSVARSPGDRQVAPLAHCLAQVRIEVASAGQIERLLNVFPLKVVQGRIDLQAPVQKSVLRTELVLPYRIGGHIFGCLRAAGRDLSWRKLW